MARASSLSAPISTKFGVEICKLIKGRNTQKAKVLLSRVLKKEEAVPFTRFNKCLAHRKNMGPGRFPVKATLYIHKLIESVEANAQFKGLNISNLIIKHIICNSASRPWRFGRQRRRKMKRTHIEVIVEEISEKPSKPKTEKTKETKPVEQKSQKSEISGKLETSSKSPTKTGVKKETKQTIDKKPNKIKQESKDKKGDLK